MSFLTYELLQLHAEIEIDETEDANRMMACLYFEVREFLGAGVRFCRVDELLAKGMPIDEILEGPIQQRMVIDEASMCTGRMVYDVLSLYQRLKADARNTSGLSLGFNGEGEDVEAIIHRKSPLQAYAVSPFSRDRRRSCIKEERKILQRWNRKWCRR